MTPDRYYFYPRSPCGERLLTEINKMATGQISIHALLAESDLPTGGQTFEINLFLSTLSLRRATPFSPSGPMTRPYFYPRSPCGERLTSRKSVIYLLDISIHALLAESDKAMYTIWACTNRFLSTLSLRRATLMVIPIAPPSGFLSTLSLRRATAFGGLQAALSGDFYPRSPCGERRVWAH